MAESTGEKDRKDEQDDEGESGASAFEWMASMMKELKMKKPGEDVKKILDSPDLDNLIRYILSGKCKNIITMAGAGISTSAGIPDFRSPGTGLYDNLAKYNLPHPTAIFEISFFLENPEPFFVLAKSLYPGTFKPTLCHYFLRLLQEKGLLLRHYTQNIDTLERVAGLSDEKLVEAHGTFHTSHCLKCKKLYSQEWIKEKVFSDTIPKCIVKDCNGLVKPDIVFFGEGLPDRFFKCMSADFSKCDLLIILGTSLVVQPFASLPDKVPETTPRLYINLESTTEDKDPLAALFGMGGGFKFNDEDNYRDVFWQGTCDDGCQLLAEKLGWKNELEGLIKAGTAASVVADKKTSDSPPGASGQAKTKNTGKSTAGASVGAVKKTSDSPPGASGQAKTKNTGKSTAGASVVAEKKTSDSPPGASDQAKTKNTGKPTASVNKNKNAKF